MALATPNPIDMTTLAHAQSWIPAQSTEDADVLQRIITGVSRYVVRLTGARLDPSPSSPTSGMSSLNSQVNFTDQLDGNGSNVLFLGNRPVRNILSLLVNGYAPPINVGYGQAGVYIENSKYSVAFGSNSFGGSQSTTVGWPVWGPSGRFPMGRGNVLISYLAGFGVESQVSLASVADASGTTTVYTGTTPAGDSNGYVGQFFIVSGFLTAANNGTFYCTASTDTTITLSNAAGVTETDPGTATTYTTPEDLEVAVLEIVQLAYVRRDRSGLDSENVQGSAATTYAKYEIPPDAAAVLRTYTRVPLGAQS